MIVKVCGITLSTQYEALVSMGIDLAGLIFVPESKRYVVSRMPARYLPLKDHTMKRVGVFQNKPLDELLQLAEEYDLDVIQLHGNESPEFAARVKEARYRVIKVIPIGNDTGRLQQTIQSYDGAIDWLLFDTLLANGQSGGTGQQFNWDILHQLQLPVSFFLSGGIGPEHKAALQEFQHPQFLGVDVNSKFEVSPGVKDLSKLEDWLHKIR